VALPVLKSGYGQQEIWTFSTAMPLSQIEWSLPYQFAKSLSLQLICFLNSYFSQFLNVFLVCVKIGFLVSDVHES
jgi:hypothetical protein